MSEVRWTGTALSIPLLLAVAGCGSGEQESSTEDLRTYDVQDEMSAPTSANTPPSIASSPADFRRGHGGPDISPTAAPGVAFSYRYAFQLPAARLDQVQEQHARTCERLGVSRCRITGMRYRVDRNGDIEGLLAFKLEPGLARRFGRSALESVVQAEGMLIDAEISGDDVGQSIRSAVRNAAELTDELNRIEARLSGPGVNAAERARLEGEAQRLRQQIRALEANQEEQQESLANTPMLFQYGSGELAPGFDEELSFSGTAERAMDNFRAGILILFLVLVTIAPWLLLGALIWWGAQSVRRRFGSTGEKVPVSEPETI